MNKMKIVNVAALAMTLAGIMFGAGAPAHAAPAPGHFRPLRFCVAWRISYFPIKHKVCVKWMTLGDLATDAVFKSGI